MERKCFHKRVSRIPITMVEGCLPYCMLGYTPPGRAPLEVTFFAVIISFEYKIAISANFVQTVKNSIGRLCEALIDEVTCSILFFYIPLIDLALTIFSFNAISYQLNYELRRNNFRPLRYALTYITFDGMVGKSQPSKIFFRLKIG